MLPFISTMSIKYILKLFIFFKFTILYFLRPMGPPGPMRPPGAMGPPGGNMMGPPGGNMGPPSQFSMGGPPNGSMGPPVSQMQGNAQQLLVLAQLP